MTVTVTKIIAAGFLSASNQAVSSPVAVNATQIIGRAVFSNTDSASHTITVNIVPTAGSASASNQIIDARTLQPGETYVSVELAGYVLITGDAIYANASLANKVNITVSGVTIT